jgi:cAMP-dependent protein kinase regulator
MRLRKNAKVELISNVPLFSTCSKKELERIAAVADEIDFQPGKELTRQGAPGREFFILINGSAEVTRGSEPVRTLVGGDFFGELALLSDAPRSATVTTVTPIVALVVTETNFKRVLRESPAISDKVLQAAADRTAADEL